MLSTKNVLVTTALLTQCILCIAANEVPSSHKMESGKKLDDFKNKDMLVKNIIPDVSLLAASLSDRKKYGSLNGLITVWTNALHDDGHFEITKGEFFFKS